jgi:hypothetical protein
MKKLRSQPVFLKARNLRLERRVACGSCPRCENVENPKAGFPHFHKRVGKLAAAKSAAASFPQLPQGPTTRFFFSLKNEKQKTKTSGLENVNSNCRQRKK